MYSTIYELILRFLLFYLTVFLMWFLQAKPVTRLSVWAAKW